jgi:hypothetical protein
MLAKNVYTSVSTMVRHVFRVKVNVAAALAAAAAAAT